MPSHVSAMLSERLGGDWSLQRLYGSSFCATWRATPAGRAPSARDLFVKSAPASGGGPLLAEADGLAALAAVGGLGTPGVVGCWTAPSRDIAMLALTWLDLASAHAPDFGEAFGSALASLHNAAPTEGEGRFGWRRDNWLGGTPQPNRWSAQGGLAGWLEFLADQRFGAMASRLCAARVAPVLLDAVQRLIDALPCFFDDGHVPRPSLIHGDLWSGNWGSLRDGSPVVFDPAVSTSDAEAELAMMELFGAPPPGFWRAYRQAAPLAAGYARRRPVYQLYHLLNHALLFGGSYVSQSMRVIGALLAGR